MILQKDYKCKICLVSINYELNKENFIQTLICLIYFIKICIYILEGIMDGENADFGELFSQFAAMKEHAASLPTNERRIMAEQVVTAFWKAMGGDLLEIED